MAIRLTESQLRKIVRQEILREAGMKGVTMVRGPDGSWVPSGGMSDFEGPGAMAASRMRAGRPGVPGSLPFDDMEPSLVDLVDFAENNELFEHPFDDGYAMDLIQAYLDEELAGMQAPESWKSSALDHLEAEHGRRFR